ncbi:hypothetical protein KJ840_00265 [Patescibacteria group bacterium]|nr:hypothetical protein [Patescibacteria group bacterium]
MYTKQAEKLITTLKQGIPENFYAGEGISRIQVDVFVSRIAKIYEKIRNAIDYKEEHLLRKNAILRIIQRRLTIKISSDVIAFGLIKELVRAGYLDNNFIPERKVDQAQKIIEKYLAIFNLSGARRTNGRGQKLFRWLLEICACEIEESLMPPLQQRALVEFVYQLLRPEIKLLDKDLSPKDKDLHVYLAIYRALVKSDASMINFLLFKYYYPGWVKVSEQTQIMEAAKKIRNLKKEIERHQKHPLNEKLFRIFKKQAFTFFVLRDIILANPKQAEDIFNNPQQLEYHIRTTCDKLYKKARTKLRRSIVRVTIYIFITKMFLALLLEFPYDYYIAKEITYLPLAINALFPPLLMVFIGTFIRVPSKKNTDKVVKLSNEIIYHNKIGDIKGLGNTVKHNSFFKLMFNILYFVLFSVSFGVLIYILLQLQFNVFSILVFLLFLSLISFFGIKLRYNIRDLIVFDKKENPLVFLINLFSLPFLNAGHWLSVKFQKINVFAFILDFIIEAPFKIFLEVIEDWISFLREKKEEIYNQE